MKQSLQILVVLLVVSWRTGSVSYAQAEGQKAKDRPAALPARLDLPVRGPLATAVNLRALRTQLQVFQDLLNRTIRQTFETPFSLLQDTKGSYLPNYGAVFHLEVNLHPLRLITPFDMRPYTAEELQKARDSKLERVRHLKSQLSAFLLEQGGRLSEIPADQSVAIVVHLFNLSSERSEDLPTQLVIETSRAALLEAQAQRLSAEEFRKKALFLDF